MLEMLDTEAIKKDIGYSSYCNYLKALSLVEKSIREVRGIIERYDPRAYYTYVFGDDFNDEMIISQTLLSIMQRVEEHSIIISDEEVVLARMIICVNEDKLDQNYCNSYIEAVRYVLHMVRIQYYCLTQTGKEFEHMDLFKEALLSPVLAVPTKYDYEQNHKLLRLGKCTINQKGRYSDERRRADLAILEKTIRFFSDFSEGPPKLNFDLKIYAQKCGEFMDKILKEQGKE